MDLYKLSVFVSYLPKRMSPSDSLEDSMVLKKESSARLMSALRHSIPFNLRPKFPIKAANIYLVKYSSFTRVSKDLNDRTDCRAHLLFSPVLTELERLGIIFNTDSESINIMYYNVKVFKREDEGFRLTIEETADKRCCNCGFRLADS